MKKIVITGWALMSLLQLSAQNTPKDSTTYKSTKLKIEEINLVSSLYQQEGNNSSVTGGIGTEKLTDISNTLDVKLFKYFFLLPNLKIKWVVQSKPFRA